MKGHVRGASPRSTVSAAAYSSRRFAAISVAAGLLLAFFASSAFAGAANERPLLFSFDPGIETSGSIAVDDASGAVYVVERSPHTLPSRLVKFHPDGTPWNFSATGSNEIPISTSEPRIAVDNSGTASQGRIYVGEQHGALRVDVFAASGELLSEVETTQEVDQFEDIAIDAAGHLWLFGRNAASAFEYDMATTPPTQVNSYDLGQTQRGDVDANGAIYLDQFGPVRKFVNGVFERTIGSSAQNGDIDLDQSSPDGHLFIASAESLGEFEQDGTEVVTSGSLDLSGLGLPYATEAREVAYDPTLDRTYVLAGRWNYFATDRAAPSVLVFGSPASGTVPDVTIAAPTGVAVSGAHLAGTVNPLGTDAEWYFQWKESGGSWVAAEAGPAASLPNDTSVHSVEFDATSLRGGTNYEVRLVARNGANQLRAASDAEPFTTEVASAPPVVAIDPASDITTDSATITGTIDPEGDTADWQVELSTQSDCSAGFEAQPARRLSPGTTSPTPVEASLSKLLPSQHYCARISATNSSGTVVSPVVEFTTDPVPATELEAIGVAPRLDTSARLNARINPQGEDLTYRFQYSSDGGGSWQTLPDLTDESGAHSQIVISEVARDLQPATTYLFRVSIENPVGGGQSEERAFTTRTSSEVSLPPRGYELVNNPDKGNQNVLTPVSERGQGPMSEDGEKVLWEVTGGAPGGFNGSGALFLAARTPSGWTSRSVLPPPSLQVGGGNYLYQLAFRSDDLSTFLFGVARPLVHGLGTVPDTTYVRLDDSQHQQVLHQFDSDLTAHSIEATDNGSHLLTVDGKQEGQIVDIGSGTPELVSLMPDGTEASCQVWVGGGFGGSDGFLGGGAEEQWTLGNHMIATDDASIIYFETKPNGSCASQLGLYVRDRDAGKTQLIDLGQKSQSVQFIRATPDGSQAYFMTKSQLDPADENFGDDIYRWDLSSGESTCLTCIAANARAGELPTNSRGSHFVRVSDDFSRIYFESKALLVPGKGRLGQPNLYLLANGQLHFVAPAEADLSTAELTRDGGVLVFRAPASRELTSDPTSSVCKEKPEDSNIRNCEQFYRYEASEESIECVSCASGGITTTAAPREAWDMSADGSTIAVGTRETVLPSIDINRRNDIYEWRNGVIRLITNGTTEFPDEGQTTPKVAAVSRDGGSILYSAPEPGLTGYEQDGLANLYEARIGGGFPRPIPPAHCSEESCQGPLQAAPVERTPGSSSGNGPGNAKENSKPRRHTRCAKAHKRGRRQCGHKKGRKPQRNHRRPGRGSK